MNKRKIQKGINVAIVLDSIRYRIGSSAHVSVSVSGGGGGVCYYARIAYVYMLLNAYLCRRCVWTLQ